MTTARARKKGPALSRKRAATSGLVAERIRRANDAGAGWSDFSLPDLSDLLSSYPEVQAGSLLPWLARQMARYKASHDAEGARGKPSDDREYIDQLQAATKRLLDLTESCNTPDAVDGKVYLAYRHMARDWFADRATLQAELTSLDRAIDLVLLDPDGIQAKAGRPSMGARSELLGAVVEHLRGPGFKLKADAARALAADLLDRCGVPVPLVKGEGETRAIRRAERRGPK